MSHETLSREQIWEEIESGKRKISFWKFPSFIFPRSNTALLAGILSFLGILHLGIWFGIWGIIVGRKALKDTHEKKIKAYRIKARIGIILSIIGFISGILSYLVQNRI